MYNYHGQFEVHITVRLANQAQLDEFQAWCRVRRCKCIRIVLARGKHTEQPMATWRRADATLPVVLEEARQCAAGLEGAGLPVVRLKIEADPANDDVPLCDADASAHADGNYFEHHVKLLRDVAGERERLLQVCLANGAHLSRNALREPHEGREERFVTLRCYHAGRTSSERQLQQLLAALEGIGENIIDVESEYSVYDSNLDLDAGWLPPS